MEKANFIEKDSESKKNLKNEKGFISNQLKESETVNEKIGNDSKENDNVLIMTHSEKDCEVINEENCRELKETELKEKGSDDRGLNGDLKEEDGLLIEDGDHVTSLPKLQAVDGGYGWMVVLGCCVMHVMVGGWNRCYGVTYVEVRRRYDSSAAMTAWVGGAATAMRMGFSPIATTLSNRFSPRGVVFVGGILFGLSAVLNSVAPNVQFLFFSHSFVGGFGGSLLYAPCIVMVTHYFEKRRSVALGIATCGSGLGLFLFPPLLEYLYSYYGYFGTMIIMGGILFNSCISGALNRPLLLSQPDSIRQSYKRAQKLIPKETKSDLRKYLDLTLWKEPSFVLFVISLGFQTSCYIPTQFLLVDMAHAKGVPLTQASLLLSAVGLMDMLTRLLSGIVFDWPSVRSRMHHAYNVALLLTGASSVLFIFAPSFPWLMFLSIVQGIGCGVVTAQRAAMATDLVGVARMSSSFGLTVFVQGIGLFAGPALAGYLRDVTGGYTWSYIFMGGCGCVSSIFYLINSCIFYHKRPLALEQAEQNAMIIEVKV